MSTNIIEAITRCRQAFAKNRTKEIAFRVSQLKALDKCIEENRELWLEALNKDLCKSRTEAIMTELGYTQSSIKEQILHINDNTKPRPVSKSILIQGKAFILNEPFGTVLIIGPWNFPVQLTLVPLIGAIAAGNCVIVKPSEVSKHTSNVIEKLLPKYLDNECYHVISGGIDVSQQLLNEKFDYIFFAGAPSVGRIVAQAAAKHLTPVTLELGGKSPVFIDDSVKDMETVCKRIIFGKLMNSGQVCVGPDYLLCSDRVQQNFIDNFKKVVKKLYGENPKESNDLGRIINDHHFKRITKLIQMSGKAVVGGDSDDRHRYIGPTVLVDVSPDDPIMQEEIFGPVLPIITVSSAEEAIDFIGKRDKPLALYLFSNDKHIIKKFLDETSSGSVCVNDTVLQISLPGLPFGGVGASGMGRYHGKASFDTFSNKKSVLVRSLGNNFIENYIRYPPMTEIKAKLSEHVFLKLNYYLDPNHWYNFGTYSIYAVIIGILLFVLFKSQ